MFYYATCFSLNKSADLFCSHARPWHLRPRSDSRHSEIFWEVVGLEQGTLSLVSAIEELLGRKSSGSSLEIWEYGHRDPSRWPRGTLYLQKLALTSSTSSGCLVSIVCSWTWATAPPPRAIATLFFILMVGVSVLSCTLDDGQLGQNM
jgi:hypothetical protein